MKHLRLWESHKTEVEVAEICKYYGIKNWSLNSQGLVDVSGKTYLDGEGLSELPLHFGEVEHFDCSRNNLTSLTGSPRKVNGSFIADFNKLKTLEGAPEIVTAAFSVFNNELTTLKGSPQVVVGGFDCRLNNLTNLEGSPKKVGRYFQCNSRDTFISLKGAPEIIGAYFECDFNNLTSLEGLPKSIAGKSSSEWLLSKFREEEFQISLVSTIPDYALTPKLLAFVRTRYPDQYNLLRQRRDEDQRWKTDLSADMSNLGFD